jgi:hypothetical protein
LIVFANRLHKLGRWSAGGIRCGPW